VAELDITLMRIVQLCFSGILFGVPLFSIYGPHEALARTRHVVSTACIGLIAAFVAAVVLQTASLTGTPISILDGVWYLTDTRMGFIYILRFLGLLGYISLIAAAPANATRAIMQAIIGGGLLGSFAWAGHGAGNPIHAVVNLFHILAAGVWFGALIGLGILVIQAHRDAVLIGPTARGLDAFSKIGVGIVAVLVASGIANALFALGLPDVASFPQNEYARTLVIKLMLLTAMLVLAAINRYRLVPLLMRRIGGTQIAPPLRYLRRSVLLETVLAATVFAFAAHLASIDPSG
jgi:putative copper resistance protein D